MMKENETQPVDTALCDAYKSIVVKKMDAVISGAENAGKSARVDFDAREHGIPAEPFALRSANEVLWESVLLEMQTRQPSCRFCLVGHKKVMILIGKNANEATLRWYASLLFWGWFAWGFTVLTCIFLSVYWLGGDLESANLNWTTNHCASVLLPGCISMLLLLVNLDSTWFFLMLHSFIMELRTREKLR